MNEILLKKDVNLILRVLEHEIRTLKRAVFHSNQRTTPDENHILKLNKKIEHLEKIIVKLRKKNA